MTELDRQKLKQIIISRLEEMRALDAGAIENRAIVQLDQQSVGRLSRMDAMQQQAMARATAARRQGEIARLEAALGRITDDEFGYCADCGDEIAMERLCIEPAIRRCAECTRNS